MSGNFICTTQGGNHQHSMQTITSDASIFEVNYNHYEVICVANVFDPSSQTFILQNF